MKVVSVIDGTATAKEISDGLLRERTAGKVWFDLEIVRVETPQGAKFLSENAADAEIKEYAGTPEQLIPYVSDADVIAVHIAPVPKSVQDAAPRLKLIACARGGPVNVNTSYAKDRGIKVTYTPGRNADAVADMTIGMMIMQSRNLLRAASLMKADPSAAYSRSNKNTFTGTELFGKTLGLIGLGAVGRKVARRALGFDMKVLVSDPYIDPKMIEKEGCQPASVEEVLKEADYVSLHMKLTEETADFINADTISLMKSTAILINTARGGLIDEKALYNALKENRIAGAALDVLKEEPPGADNPLLKLDNITLFPHICGMTKEINARGSAWIIEDILRFIRGEELLRPLYR